MSDVQELFPVRPRKARAGTKIFWVLVALATIAIPACLFLMEPQYRAIAYVQVEEQPRHSPLSLDRPFVPLEQVERMVADQVVRLTSDAVILESLKSYEIMQTGWYQEGKSKAGGDVHNLLDELKNKLEVRQVPKTNYIEVAFRAEKREDAAKIVNAVISRYMADVEAANKSALRREWETYRNQTAEKLNQLRSARERVRQFASTQFRFPGVEAGVTGAADEYRVLREEVLRLEAIKLQAKARYEDLKGMAPEALPNLPEVRQAVESDPRVQWLRQEILAAQVAVEAKTGETAETVEEVKGLRARLSALEGKLPELIAQRARQENERLLRAAESEYLSAARAELQMRERLESSEAVMMDMDVKMGEYNNMRGEVDLVEEEYRQLQAVTNQLGLLQAGNSSRVRLLGTAEPPNKRDYHRSIVSAAAIGAVPLVFGVLLVIVRGLGANLRRV